MKKIAVLLSNKGTGSNLAAILNAIDKGIIKNGKVMVVVSNKKDAYGLVRAKERKIPIEVLDLKDFKAKGKTRLDYDNYLGKLLKEKYKVDLVILAGWMLILSEEFIKYFPDKTINLHPSLLPEVGEKYVIYQDKKLKPVRGEHTDNAVQYAIDQGYPVAGSTVHFITEKVDEGPVIIRSYVKIQKDDTVDSLYERMKKEEHKILPQAIAWFCDDKLKIKNNKVIIK